MKFKLHYTHDYGQYKDIEINTLEELLKLVKKEDWWINWWIIVSLDKEVDWQYVLEVYDDYRE